jgi:predicted PurR-regulated permease PerM
VLPVERSPVPAVRVAPSLGAVLGVLVALGALALLVVAGRLTLLVVLGAVLAYLLSPVVDALERRGMSHAAAAAAVFFGLFALIAALTTALAPVALHEAAVLREEWGGGRVYDLLDQAERDLVARFPVLDYGMLDFAGVARRAMGRPGNQLLGYVPDVLSGLTDGIIVPFVLFFLLRDGPGVRRRMVAVVPNRYFEFVMGVLYKIDAHLGGYLRSQSLVALFVGALTTIGLGVAGVSNYAVLGFLTGILNFVPYVGFFISFLLTVAVSVVTTGGFGQVPAVAAVFAVAQGLENFALQPWITGRTISLHPVTVLLAIFIGDRAFGVMGMALAVPAAAVLKVVVVETLVTLRRFRL